MLRKITLALVAAASLGVMALLPRRLPQSHGAVDGAAVGVAAIIIITTSGPASASLMSAAMPTTVAMWPAAFGPRTAIACAPSTSAIDGNFGSQFKKPRLLARPGLLFLSRRAAAGTFQ
ncbi:hypothetical protein [Bradyrhizobium sp.]|uniref:hypothetical protein n=1 Tax=Bradyrhizobium sp. TaxID=376 RepID=UPI002DF9F3F1|nr:hypothetical protein [Bradyrhizobium sp.]